MPNSGLDTFAKTQVLRFMCLYFLFPCQTFVIQFSTSIFYRQYIIIWTFYRRLFSMFLFIAYATRRIVEGDKQKPTNCKYVYVYEITRSGLLLALLAASKQLTMS